MKTKCLILVVLLAACLCACISVRHQRVNVVNVGGPCGRANVNGKDGVACISCGFCPLDKTCWVQDAFGVFNKCPKRKSSK